MAKSAVKVVVILSIWCLEANGFPMDKQEGWDFNPFPLWTDSVPSASHKSPEGHGNRRVGRSRVHFPSEEEQEKEKLMTPPDAVRILFEPFTLMVIKVTFLSLLSCKTTVTWTKGLPIPRLCTLEKPLLKRSGTSKSLVPSRRRDSSTFERPR